MLIHIYTNTHVYASKLCLSHTVSIKELSNQMATARMDFEQGEVDERVKVLMEGMRGKSLNDDDFAAGISESCLLYL